VDAARFSPQGINAGPDIPEVQPPARNFHFDRNEVQTASELSN